MTGPESDHTPVAAEPPLPVIPSIGLRRGSGGRYNGQFRPEFSRVHLDGDLLWITPLPVRYVLAVVGRRWAGKGAVVSYLQEKRGFAAHNLQRVVRHEAERQGRDAGGRAVRQQIADALRAEHLPPGRDVPQALDGDPAYLARRALRRIRDRYAENGRVLEPPRRIVVGGFSHQEELIAFRNLPNCHVIRVCCRSESRQRRAHALGLLERDLESYRAQAFPGAQTVDATDIDAVFELVDGYDVDGRAAAPWAASCAQNVGGLLDCVQGWAGGQPSPPTGQDPSCAVFDVDTGEGTPLSSVYSRLDRIIDSLDQRYLLRRP
jgi:hypothetical protein